jgi:serine/threonine protein kinase
MIFYVINFIAFEYHKNSLFHGDLKPDNIFFHDKNDFYMTTDLGSLLYLEDQKESDQDIP